MNLSEQVTKQQVKNILDKLKSGKTITRREQLQIEAYENGKAAPKTTREWADFYKVSHVTIINWGKAGAPLNGTPEEFNEWRAAQVKKEPGGLSAAKLKKTLLESEKIELVISQLKRELIGKKEVREQGIAIGAALSAEIGSMMTDMPGALAGLDEIGVRERLQARLDLMLERTNDRLRETTD